VPGQHSRGLTDSTVEPRFLIIGRVVKPHGVRGEMRVESHTELPERFNWLESVFVGLDNPEEVAVEGVRFHKNWILLKLAGFDNREEAQALRSQWLQIREETGLPLAEGQYYLYQVIGLDVFTDLNEYLGRVTEVMETGANNVFVVKGDRGEVLIPDIEDVILDIDFDQQRMTIHLLPGLLDS